MANNGIHISAGDWAGQRLGGSLVEDIGHDMGDKRAEDPGINIDRRKKVV